MPQSDLSAAVFSSRRLKIIFDSPVAAGVYHANIAGLHKELHVRRGESSVTLDLPPEPKCVRLGDEFSIQFAPRKDGQRSVQEWADELEVFRLDEGDKQTLTLARSFQWKEAKQVVERKGHHGEGSRRSVDPATGHTKAEAAAPGPAAAAAPAPAPDDGSTKNRASPGVEAVPESIQQAGRQHSDPRKPSKRRDSPTSHRHRSRTHPKKSLTKAETLVKGTKSLFTRMRGDKGGSGDTDGMDDTKGKRRES